MLDDACDIDDSADLELLAGTLLLPLSIPGVPEAARRVVVDAIAARADPIAAATLAALAVFAPAGLAAHAHEAAVLLAGRGVTHPAVAHIGTLSVDSAAVGADDDTEMIVAVLARPASRDRQVLVVGIDATLRTAPAALGDRQDGLSLATAHRWEQPVGTPSRAPSWLRTAQA